MDINVNEVVFEGGEYSPGIMTQFLGSGYFVNNSLQMDRFLDEDRTIDLEKLELGISLAIYKLENSEKIEEPIKVFLGNMDRYFLHRGIQSHEIDRIIEESSFILGYCKAIADEISTREVIISY